MYPIEGRKIIVDTDMGPDDAWALIFLLKAAAYYNLTILGITCSHGNTNIRNVARNTMRLLDTVDRLDIPVYLGATESIVQEANNADPYFGVDGFGDQAYSKEPPMHLVKNMSAISAMYHLVKEHKNVTLICLAPLTNIGLALRVYPDITTYIDQVFIMGGNYGEKRNYKPSPEFNFNQDPEAAYIVLKAIRKPLVILPWETMLPPQLNLTSRWRFGVLGAVKNKLMDLLNSAEKVFEKEELWTPADPVLMAIFISPKKVISKAKILDVTIELKDPMKRGVMVIQKHGKKESNVAIITKVNENYLKRMFLWAAGMKGFKTKTLLKSTPNSKNHTKWFDLESIKASSTNDYFRWLTKYECQCEKIM